MSSECSTEKKRAIEDENQNFQSSVAFQVGAANICVTCRIHTTEIPQKQRYHTKLHSGSGVLCQTSPQIFESQIFSLRLKNIRGATLIESS